MPVTSLGVRTTNTTSAQAAAEIRTTSGVKPKVVELQVGQSSNTASSYGLGRPAAVGVGPSNTSTFVDDDPNDPNSTLLVALAWTTSPTAPAPYSRRWNSAATTGVGVIFVFPRGLAIPVATQSAVGSFVLFNITTTVACDFTVVVDE